MAITNKTPAGSPIASCLKKRLRRRRLASQYSTNLVSSSVSIVKHKNNHRDHPIAIATQIIYYCVTNSNTLKLAYLIAQYLYANKRLDLPGIGSFILDPSIIIDTENSKHRSPMPEGISFQNNPSIQNAPDLVNFISSKSGKMKVLAESDLESHLQMIHQFLNINKPFSFDGIGTLIKVRQGVCEFTPGHIITNKPKDNPEKEKQTLSKKENLDAKYMAYLATPAVKSYWKKPVVALLILCGIGFTLWGGYTISTKQNQTAEATLSENNLDPAVPETNTVQVNKDSAIVQKPNITASYKYVLEIAKATRAFNRLKTLKDSKLSNVVQMETADSVQYKLFVLLPATTDTTRAIDSLTAFLGKKVYIERQN